MAAFIPDRRSPGGRGDQGGVRDRQPARRCWTACSASGPAAAPTAVLTAEVNVGIGVK
jgi:hypothetical protein